MSARHSPSAVGRLLFVDFAADEMTFLVEVLVHLLGCWAREKPNKAIGIAHTQRMATSGVGDFSRPKTTTRTSTVRK